MKKNKGNNIGNTMRLLIAKLLVFVMFSTTAAGLKNTTRVETVNVGLVVDYGRWIGKMGKKCIEMAVSDFYGGSRRHKTRLLFHARDSNSDPIEAASAALDLIKNVKVQAIIGPVSSIQASFVADLGDKAKVPIISYSATSASLNIRSSYFFQATQNQTFQVKAISSLVRAFGWKQVVPIYVDNEHGQGLIPHLTDALQEVDSRLSYRCAIPAHASDDHIARELYKLMTMQTRVFVVHTDVALGSRVFVKAKEIGMMGKGYVWIATSGMSNYLSSMDSSAVDAMEGVLGIRTYVPETDELRVFRDRWKSEYKANNHKTNNNNDHGLNVYGLWAYDAATALAIAVEKAGNERFGFEYQTNYNNSSTTDLDALGFSLNGPNLRKALLGVTFKGLSGNFSLVNGHLDPSILEIINVVGNVGRVVGFWTPQRGLVNSLETNNDAVTKKDDLGQISWPGRSSSIPKGWEIPTNRKKLRIGVPKKAGFKEYVDVQVDSVTNDTIVTGFCIDVFEAVVKELPYSVDYEFIPFTKLEGKASSVTYDELVYQVFLGEFDAVVGDTTIRANRSTYVDFTLPYTESGVSMIVPVRDERSKNDAWTFLKPFTLELWVTCFCSFVFIGFVIWVLEHRINEDFRGPPSYEIGTILWFSFSTMVFAHRERVASNWSRFVVVIWVFVILIVTQSYTASLTSLLTVQKLRPTVTDVNQLIRNNDNVGYIDGSFVHGVLIDLGFRGSQLRIYKSPEDCDDLFSKKKADGGIAAAIDEVPYMKFLLKKYCSKYTMVEPSFKTGGFGFVFPKGSPLVPDVSRAILSVTEKKTIKNIENKWFPEQTSCPDPTTQVSSNSLGLESFWGLFLIVGVVSLFSLAVHFLKFLYEQRHVLLRSDSTDRDDKVPIQTRIRLALRIFDQKDLSSHTFKKSNRASPDTRNFEGSVRHDRGDCYHDRQ